MSEPNYPYIQVSLNIPIYDPAAYCYVLPENTRTDLTGCRVRVNFAGRDIVGVIIDVLQAPPPDARPGKSGGYKTAVLLDSKPVIDKSIMQMLRFGSTYYHYPLGQCLWTALPAILRNGGEYKYEEIPGLELADNLTAEKTAKIKAESQLGILNALKNGALRRKELRERGFTSQAEQALLKKGLVRIIDLSPPRDIWQHGNMSITAGAGPQPNPDQEDAINTINAAKGFQTFLIDGVTGSGKTEVYLRIIEHVLSQGRAALVLVPEIALTPQTFERFYRRFNVPVSSMHSALSDRERLDAHLDMSSGRSAILIGTRTALFTPIPNLGLIVIDEEHDHSFMQTDSFRYHARSLAAVRAKYSDCPLVLGSATPSLESYNNVNRGLFSLINLTNRAGGAAPPKFEIVDLRREPATEGLRYGIGSTLERRVGEETAKGNQVLLFLNRRGFAHRMFCQKCGRTFTCPNCDLALTTHHINGKLCCHECGYEQPLPQVCPDCGSTSLIESVYGTEQVEEYLLRRYPDVQTERIDRDTVTTKTQLEHKLERFRRGDSQILLGTQMLAKGHDFPDVTLVGIIDADAGLFADDFRAMEGTAQLLTQVAGRAGRASKTGTAIIQTYFPGHSLYKSIADPSCPYSAIAFQMMQSRIAAKLPPAVSQCFLLCNSQDRTQAFTWLQELRDKLSLLESAKHLDIFSPVLSNRLEKLQNRYHFHILVSSDRRQLLQSFLNDVVRMLSSHKLPGSTRFAIEVDPVSVH